MSDASPSARGNRSFVTRKGGAQVKVVDSDQKESLSSAEGGAADAGGYQSGYEDGWNACFQQKEAELEELRRQLQAFTNELPEALNNYVQELEKQVKGEICDLSTRLSEVILRSEQIASHAIKAAVEEALQDPLFSGESLTLEVSPNCAELMQNAEASVSFPEQVNIVRNANLEEGDARLYCGERLVDARLSRRLEKAKEVIQRKMHNDGGDDRNEGAQSSTVEGDDLESGA